MKREDKKINVWGARMHNLKNVDVEKHATTIIVGRDTLIQTVVISYLKNY